jgi:hypothetical protein
MTGLLFILIAIFFTYYTEKHKYRVNISQKCPCQQFQFYSRKLKFIYDYCLKCRKPILDHHKGIHRIITHLFPE